MFVAGARTRPAASLPTRLEHREYLATVAAAERHRCLPSAWGAAASGLGGHISGAAHAVAAASAVDAAAAAKTGLECTDAHRPLGAARRGFRQTALLLRPGVSRPLAMPDPLAGAPGGPMPSDAAGLLRGSGEAGMRMGAPAVAAAGCVRMRNRRNA
jgi:hypothetical protein